MKTINVSLGGFYAGWMELSKYLAGRKKLGLRIFFVKTFSQQLLSDIYTIKILCDVLQVDV